MSWGDRRSPGTGDADRDDCAVAADEEALRTVPHERIGEVEVGAFERLSPRQVDLLLRRLLASEADARGSADLARDAAAPAPPVKHGPWSRFRALLRRTDFGPAIDGLSSLTGSGFDLDWGLRDASGKVDRQGDGQG